MIQVFIPWWPLSLLALSIGFHPFDKCPFHRKLCGCITLRRGNDLLWCPPLPKTRHFPRRPMSLCVLNPDGRELWDWTWGVKK